MAKGVQASTPSAKRASTASSSGPTKPVRNPTPRAPVWPTTSRRVTSAPAPGHTAIDIGGNLGDPLFAAVGGKVTDVRYSESGYGLNVRILADNGEELIYGHMQETNVRPGQRVSAGQVIGAMGNTGNSTGPHLHFEVRQPGPDQFVPGTRSTTTAIDPYSLIGLASSQGAVPAGYPKGKTVATKPTAGTPGVPLVPGVSVGAAYTLTRAGLSAYQAATSSQRADGSSRGSVFPSLIELALPEVDWVKVGGMAAGAIIVLIALIRLTDRNFRSWGVYGKTGKVVKAAAGFIPGVGELQTAADVAKAAAS